MRQPTSPSSLAAPDASCVSYVVAGGGDEASILLAAFLSLVRLSRPGCIGQAMPRSCVKKLNDEKQRGSRVMRPPFVIPLNISQFLVARESASCRPRHQSSRGGGEPSFFAGLLESRPGLLSLACSGDLCCACVCVRACERACVRVCACD